MEELHARFFELEADAGPDEATLILSEVVEEGELLYNTRTGEMVMVVEGGKCAVVRRAIDGNPPVPMDRADEILYVGHK